MTLASSESETAWSGTDLLVLLVTFVSGAVVMVVEVLGSRILSPFFGVGLFIWSALLSVTLAALAIGYFVGGVAADRNQSAVLIFRLALVAGCLVALVPAAARFVLAFSDSLGIRLGALFSATILFGPPLVVMGMITTVGTRWFARDARRAGRGVGLIYAVSTLGGLLGTLLAGFVLVPRLAVEWTFSGTAALLILTAVVALALRGRSRSSVAALALPFLGLRSPTDEIAPGVVVLDRSESLLGRLSVIQDTTRGAPLRLLRADHSFIGGHWTETKEPAFGFIHILEAVRLARPNGRRLLQIGLGVGSVPMSLARYGIRTDVVEIDPEVIRLATAYFGYRSTGETHVEDARTFIRAQRKQYDFVIHDAFTGGAVPEHLLSLEVLQRIREILVPNGVLALNVVGAASGALSESTRAIHRTVRSAFPHVRTFRDGPADERAQSISNVIFFASTGPLAFPIAGPFESASCEETLTTFQQWEVHFEFDGKAPPVTDARNPLGRLALPVSEDFRKAMNDLYPPAFWLE